MNERMICTEDGTEIRPATPAEIHQSDQTIEGWITVADADGKVYVDGEPNV